MLSKETYAPFLWLFATIVLATLFISAGVQAQLTAGHIMLALVILTLTGVTTAFLLRQTYDDTQQKSKRESIDNMLRDMSEKELSELRKRLSDGAYNEELPLDYLVDDEGKQVQRR
jgi:thiol:disulfide interchange protein